MKKIIICLALTLAPVMAQAEIDHYGYCDSVGQLAEAAMAVRQDGMPVEGALAIITDKDMQEVVRDAYKKPFFGNAEPFTSQAVHEHGEKWKNKCARKYRSPWENLMGLIWD